MSESASIPQIIPGKASWRRAVEAERIRLEIREIVRLGTDRPGSHIPAEFHDWANDLRRGRTNVIGGFFRFVDVVERRGMGLVGRRLVLRLLDLAREYVDYVFPESPNAPSAAVAVPDGPRLVSQRKIAA